MIRLRYVAVLSAALMAGACQGTTSPQQFDLEGTWTSRDFTGADIRMTLAETAREVRGAGQWTTVTEEYGFEVGGAVAGDEVSLIFRFDTRPDINFLGRFVDPEILEGVVTGDGYRREPATFEVIDLSEQDL